MKIWGEQKQRPVVLLYHSVAEWPDRPDLFNLNVNPKRFASHLDLLAAERRVLPFHYFCSLLQKGELPSNAVAITFDDGYSNNLHVAKPLLKERQLPATVFIATGFLDDAEFWWHRLERIIFWSTTCPGAVLLPFRGSSIQVTSADLNLGPDRARLIFPIWRLLRNASAAERNDILDRLSDILKPRLESGSTRPLTTSEVTELGDEELLIGAHTVNHLSLPILGLEQIEEEIIGSKRDCERLSNQRVAAFAYPFGEFDSRVTSFLSDGGFEMACTTVKASPLRTSSLFEIPRLPVEDWTDEEFYRQLVELSV